MTRTPLPRYATTISVTVEISATSEEDALQRLEAVEDAVLARLRRSAFERLPGRPRATYVEAQEPSLA